MIRFPVLPMLVAVSLLPGCFLFKNELDKCRVTREYQDAAIAPQVAVPDGLEPLPDEQRLEVPYGETNRQATPASEPCLIEPADFFDTDPV